MDQPSLSGAQRSYLRGRGQQLADSLKLGREGATPAFIQELDRLLRAHELVKIRFASADRDERPRLCEEIAQALNCACVGTVGHTALFFRQNADEAARHVQLP